MNIFEKIAYVSGRTKGHYQKGLADVFSTSGARPTVDDPTAWLDQYAWGEGLLSGRKPKNKDDFIRAFQSWVYICVKLNAQSVASVPLRLYVAKQTRGQKFKTIDTRPIDKARLKYLQSNTGLESYIRKSKEIEEVTEHPFLELMKEVNPYQNRRDLWELTMTFLDLTAETYWLLLPDNLKVPKQVHIMPSQYVNPKFGTSLDKAIEGYVYKRGATEVFIPEEHVIYFSYPNPNNVFTGFSTVRGIADAVYIQQQMDAFETALFENRARISGVITQTEFIGEKEKERLKEQYRQRHIGSRQAGKDLWLPKGLDYKRDAMTPEEISFIEGRKLNRTEIMAAFDIPEGTVITESSNRAVAEVADYRHAKNGILPRCLRIEEKLNEALIRRYDERLFCAFDNPVPEDKEFLLREQIEYTNVGAISRDEIRSGLGREPRGGLADELLVDSRFMPITGEEPEEEQVESFAKKVIEKIRRILG